MKINKAYRYRMRTNRDIEAKFMRCAGCSRKLWNLALARERDLGSLEFGVKPTHHYAMYEWLKEWRADEETNYLASDIGAHMAQKVLKSLYLAIRDGKRKASPKKPPRFKAWRNRDRSFGWESNVCVMGDRLYVPMVGWIRFRMSRPMIGRYKTATISLDAGKWYVSIVTEADVPEPVHPSGKAVGISIEQDGHMYMSDGSRLNLGKAEGDIIRLEKRIEREQKRLARKFRKSKTVDGQKIIARQSNNYEKNRARLERLHAKARRIRGDHLHKHSHAVTTRYKDIYIEDRSIQGMTAAGKGNAKEAKAKKNRAVLRLAPFAFRQQLEYKQLWKGGKTTAVDTKDIRDICPKCGAKGKAMAVKYRCNDCGYSGQSRRVAAINVLSARVEG